MTLGEGYRNRPYTELDWVRFLGALSVSRRMLTKFQKPNSELGPNDDPESTPKEGAFISLVHHGERY